MVDGWLIAAHSVAVMNYDPSAYSPAVSKSPDSQLQGKAATAKRSTRLSLQLVIILLSAQF